MEPGRTGSLAAAGTEDRVGGLEDPLGGVLRQRLAASVPGLDIAAGVVGAGEREGLEAEEGDRLGLGLGEGLREVGTIGVALGGVPEADVAKLVEERLRREGGFSDGGPEIQ